MLHCERSTIRRIKNYSFFRRNFGIVFDVMLLRSEQIHFTVVTRFIHFQLVEISGNESYPDKCEHLDKR